MNPASVAIVGMAGRFPGARNLAEFWGNLRDGVESVRSLSVEDLLAAGVTQEELESPGYVRRAAILDDVALFDAAFFGLSPLDASIMDPQHRHFLECAWEALEDAGHPPRSFGGSIGVFAGSGLNSYLIHNLLANRKLRESAGLFQLKQTGNDKDVLATRVAYQFDLRGPAINVQTACSTSLVAVHLACQSLLDQECDLALAGGVTIEIPHGRGYSYREGEILSRDGHCRPFDAASSGTVFGSGAGLVVLRRLEDAMRDGDTIRAVILGSAINNDGARKVGYLAPSVEGQAEVIAEALEVAGVSALDIAYVETHGTGTVVGDPIEVRALTQAFRRTAPGKAWCGLGSLKSNIGHLDAAAGVASLIKTVLALEHAAMPATLHYRQTNPHIELDDSPFFINGSRREWPRNGAPRRAGVTSLGIGGTNAHVVLEEAPGRSPAIQTRPYQILPVSARTKAALDQAVANLAQHLQEHPELNLGDAAFTCQAGRQGFRHRRAVVARDTAEAAAALAAPGSGAWGEAAGGAPPVAFLFSGQGAQYVDMGRELYEEEPAFREALNACAEGLQGELGCNLIGEIYPAAEKRDAAAERLQQTWLTQPALFSIEYALARWWMALGIRPAAMVGHSIGEYVAACLAGVFSLESALALVAARGRLMFGLPQGSMLAVPLPPTDLKVNGALSIAAVNHPELCVVSGPTDEVNALEEMLAGRSVACRRLHTSHAFHSGMMDPMLDAFRERLRDVSLSPPKLPCLSNVSGTWITAEEAADPEYWVRHIRGTVRFADCVAELLRSPEQVLLEVGPGMTLTSLARQQGGASTRAYPTLPHPREAVPALRFALQTASRLWCLGAPLEWTKLHESDAARRIPLPTYPFEHRRHWIDPDPAVRAAAPEISAPAETGAEERLTFSRRVWSAAEASPQALPENDCWIVLRDERGLGDAIAVELRRRRQEVVVVTPGSAYRRVKRERFVLRAGRSEDYDAMVGDLIRNGLWPRHVVHLWPVNSRRRMPLDEVLERSFFSPVFLIQALARQDVSDLDIALVTNRLQQAAGEAVRNPAQAVSLGPARVIPREFPGMSCRSIDIDLECDPRRQAAAAILSEMCSRRANATVALRNGRRFVETLEPFPMDAAAPHPRLSRGGVCLITGGLGGLGLTVAEHLAREFAARLVLVGRSAMPAETEWASLAADPRKSEAERKRLRALIRIREAAGGLMVVRADVTDREAMRKAVSAAQREFGRLDGVFHAAGVLEDAPLMLKTRESAVRVLEPKVRGTLVMDEVLRDVPLSCFVLFSSVSALFPPAGQVDYAAANAFLDAFAKSCGDRVTVVNWGAWREVGMAARSGSPHPWLEKTLLQRADERVYAGQWGSEQPWLLAEHRFRNGPSLIPGTGYLELAAAAWSRGAEQAQVHLSDVFFLSPLSCEPGQSREIRLQLRQEKEQGHSGVWRFSVFARANEWVEHATGRVGPLSGAPASRINRTAILERCRQQERIFDEQHRTRQERHFDFGPRWRCLRRLHLGAGEALAELVLDERFEPDTGTFHLHPALLDLATGCALYTIPGYEDCEDLYLPFAYRSMAVLQPLPRRIFSHIRLRKDPLFNGDFVTFDVTLFDDRDQVCVEIDGFTMRRIADAAKAAVTGGEGYQDGEKPLEIAPPAGIAPADGVQALMRILTRDAPPLLVTASGDTHELTNPAAPTSRHEQRDGEAGDGVEATLTAWWRELLGAETIDPDDDFFALGGHSLVGVRLLAKIRKAWHVDLELSALFQARTVRQLAARIAAMQHPATAQPEPQRCLVAIQPRGHRTPLFLIHAIGGDVLFYEPLARALGPDQPVYAFRSALVQRGNPPEMSLEELAAEYLHELRKFYPEGPCLLGGLSFGGLVAFEMAQQLWAKGEKPGAVLLLDTAVPGSAVHVAVGDQISTFEQRLRREGLHYIARKVAFKREYWGRLLSGQMRELASSWYLRRGRDIPPGLLYERIARAHDRALSRYELRPYPGRVALLRAQEREDILSSRPEETLGWEPLAAGGLQIRDIPADHSNMLLEPAVRTVARELTALLPS